MQLKPWQVGVLAYAVLYFVLVGFMEAANLSEHYPFIYVAISMVTQTLVVCGIVLYALEAGLDYWRGSTRLPIAAGLLRRSTAVWSDHHL